MQQRDLSLKTIDEFIATYPEEVQTKLQELRKLIHSVNPNLDEKISYGIPTFTLNGKNLVHFSAYEHHIGFYPGSDAIKAFDTQLKPYKTSKGAVQFPINKSIPIELVIKITRYCIEQNLQKLNK